MAEIPSPLIERFRAGRVALFVGAGCSRSAGLPGWRELLDDMIKKLDIEHFANRQQQRQIRSWLKRIDDYPRIAEFLRNHSPES